MDKEHHINHIVLNGDLSRPIQITQIKSFYQNLHKLVDMYSSNLTTKEDYGLINM